MGKSKKSDKKDDRLHKLLKKLNKINKKVNKIQKKEIEELNSPTIGENLEKDEQSANQQDIQGLADPKIENEHSSGDESIKIVSDEPNKAEDDSTKEMDEDWLEILGTDPTQSQALEMVVKPDLIKRWLFYIKNGLKKDEYESLIEKYACLKELEAPRLNPQIATTMKEFAVVRDNHMSEIQKLAGSALSVIGLLISNMYDNKEEGVDLASILTYLCDTAKILSLIVHKQSISRKAFIEPGLSKETKAILKDTEIDEFLYGKGLTDKIKEAKAINKLGENLKNSKAAPSTSTKPALNNRAPLVRRPLTQMGNTFTTGRPRQKLFFKNKQQFINHRAQMPQRPKGPPNQEKKY